MSLQNIKFWSFSRTNLCIVNYCLYNITKYKNFCNKYLSKLLLQIRKLIEMNRKFSFLLSFHFYFVNWSSSDIFVFALDFSHFLRKLHAGSIVVSLVGFIFLWQIQRSKLACIVRIEYTCIIICNYRIPWIIY